MQKVDPPGNQYMKVSQITRSTEPPPISETMQRLMNYSIMKKLHYKATHYALGRNENKFQRFYNL